MATPQELVTAAKCFDCGLGRETLLAIIAYELRALAGMAASTPQELATAAKCFDCGLGSETLLAIIAYSIEQLTGGSSGLREIYEGNDIDPNGILVPNDPTKPAIYYPSGGGTGGTLWQWEVGSQTWV